MRYNYYSIFFIICGLLILSCDNGAKSGIEGNNNKENTIIIADNVFYHGDTINKNSNKM